MDENDAILDELISLGVEAEEAHEVFGDLKEQTKAAKERWEALVLRIQIRLKSCRESHPLFDAAKKDDPPADDSGGGGGGDDGPPGPVIPPPSGDGEPIDVAFEVVRRQLLGPTACEVLRPVPSFLESEVWREVPIADLVERHGLSGKTAALMDEAGIRNLGSLSDWNRERNRLTEIPGVGEAKATEIEEVMDEFWLARSASPFPANPGGDLATSRPGTRINGAIADGEETPKRTKKKKAS